MQVCVIDQKAAPEFSSDTPQQVRTIALNQATLEMLDAAQVWPWVDKKRLGFMDSMRVIDGQSEAFTIQGKPNETLSVVIEYVHLQWALYQACLQHASIQFYFSQSIESIFQEEKQVAVRLQSGQFVEGQLLVGADGANSWLVKQLELPIEKRHYHHFACVGLASSEVALQHQALQTCDQDFILGILPTASPKVHSIVFTCDEKKKQSLLEADKTIQDCVLTNAAQNELGMMSWQTPIVPIPLIRQHLETYVADRVVFVGDAVHRIHPLAGQGANMGFADVMILIDCLVAAKQTKKDLGAASVLKSYMLQQKPKNQMFLAMHDALKSGLTDGSLLMTMSRKLGFKLLDKNHLLSHVLQKIVG
jgi:2-octaprenylphenol hydroxylase